MEKVMQAFAIFVIVLYIVFVGVIIYTFIGMLKDHECLVAYNNGQKTKKCEEYYGFE